MEVDTELSSDALIRRKRPYEGLTIFNSDSDTETETRIAAKSKPALRGKTTKGRGSGLARAKAELKAKASEAREEAFERSLRSRAFRKEPPQAVLDSEESSSSDVHTKDPTKMGAEELRAQAGRSAALILEVAQKSSNLKGGFGKKLRESAAALQAIVDALASRTEAEETRKLRADNGRLRKEVDSLKAEVKAHRRDFAEMRSKVAVVNEASTSSALDARAVDNIKASIISSIGVMINARFAELEERLPPAKIQRPPLAADKRRESAQQIAVSRAQAVNSAPPLTSAPLPKRVPPAAPPAPVAGCSSASLMSETIPPQVVQEMSWSTVVKKGKKGKQAHSPAGTNATVANTVLKTPQAAKPKLTAPRTAAVVVTLQPEAEQKGVTYAQILERAEQGIKLQELGINGGLKVRRSATGARVLELPRSQSDQAEKLADKLRTVLDGVASVVHPVKKVDIKVMGLDDSVTKDKIIAAVAREGNCAPEDLRCGEIARGPGYMGMVRVTCPIAAAKKLSDAGRLLVGWSSARVCVLEQRPLRCYKCMGLGHTRILCPFNADRGNLCFRCGVEGHKSAECTGKLRCAVCAEAGKPSGHSMAEWGIDLAVACEPYYVPPLTHWVGDVDGTVAVLARSGTGPPLSLIERGSGYVVVGWGKYVIVGTYFSPNRSLAEFETYLGFVRAAVARQSPKPTLVLGRREGANAEELAGRMRSSLKKICDAAMPRTRRRLDNGLVLPFKVKAERWYKGMFQFVSLVGKKSGVHNEDYPEQRKSDEYEQNVQKSYMSMSGGSHFSSGEPPGRLPTLA
ncbi:uncharacterized protein LOC124533073 [Vanessa cardui]|uniref:uncharacterized protein LOC124533073 n=1 Tax=Vanessa cardui TaxID=171605 RepID=UPI001F1402FB|nr:uncharacterized protein LOC124533073 [Vanessa cardui]